MGVLFLIFLPAARRTLNCMVGQMKHILATEQKKTDFRPEDENNVMIQYTTVREKNLQLALRSSHSKLNKLAKETCKSNPHLVFLRLNTYSVSDWTCFPCFSSCTPHLDRPAPRYVPTSVGRWSTCGSPWMGKMWTQCWRSWAFVSTGSSMSIYSNTATAQWEGCWPSATWLNTDDAPRTSGWVWGGVGGGA